MYNALGKHIAYRIYATAPVIVAFYGVFAVILKSKAAPDSETRAKYVKNAGDLFSWMASILLTVLVTLEVGNKTLALVTVCWIMLSIILFEAGNGIRGLALKQQGIFLALCAFIRILAFNLVPMRELFLNVNANVAAGAIAAAGLYYFYFRLCHTDELQPAIEFNNSIGAFFSYLGTAAIGFMMFFLIRTEPWIPPAWAALMFAALMAGLIIREKHFLIQALLFDIAASLGVLTMDFPSQGDMRSWVTSGIAIGVLLIARLVWHWGYDQTKEWSGVDEPAKNLMAGYVAYFFSIPAVVLLTILVPIEFSDKLANYMTIAWACEGLLFIVIGFSLRDRFLRFFSLGLLSVCVVKVFYDLWILDIDRVYKVMALIGLGAILILIGFIYSRFREKIKQLMLD